MSRKIIITGANNGIGYYLASELLAKGDQVAAIDLSTGNLEKLKSSFSQSLEIYKGDVTNDKRVKEIVNEFAEKIGGIDILINNACLAIFKPFEEKSLEETAKEFAVNYYGYIHMINAVLPLMMKQRTGIIHNFSSGVGLTGFPGIYGYASTKAAIEALSRTLSIELADYGITINIIHPPLTNTQSARPLGVPQQVMADAQVVGKRLANKIGLKKPIITPDFQTSLGLFFNRAFPDMMGKFLARMTAQARSQADI